MNKLIIATAFGLAVTSAFADSSDRRQILQLTEPQRAHVLDEMRALLAGTQNILAALSKDDMAAVAQHARSLGMSMARKSEDHLKGVLPKEFMGLGSSVHQDFDKMASDAESVKDPKLALRQLSDSMNKCVACHATYQIRATARTKKPAATTDDHKH